MEPVPLPYMLGVDDLGALLHLTPATVKKFLVEKPKALPPRLIIEGQRKVLWLGTDVAEWLNSRERCQGTNPAFRSPPVQPGETRRRPGRPKNAEVRRLAQTAG